MIPSTAGYVFHFQGHGAFDPSGKIAEAPTFDEVESHNRQLARREIEAMKTAGRGILYLFYTKEQAGNRHLPSHVGTWASSADERFAITYRTSRNNWGAKRTDVWFRFDGSIWHGVNIGDNDIVRCKRTAAKS